MILREFLDTDIRVLARKIRPYVSTIGIPNQTGHAGQYVTTNGTTASWAAGTANGFPGVLTADTVLDLNGHVLTFSQDEYYLRINVDGYVLANTYVFQVTDPEEGVGTILSSTLDHTTYIRAIDTDGDLTVQAGIDFTSLLINEGGQTSTWNLKAVIDSKQVSIVGNATESNPAGTITYTADTHTFNGVVSLDSILKLTVFTNSSPTDGDVWREDNTNTGLKVRINGATKTITVS